MSVRDAVGAGDRVADALRDGVAPLRDTVAVAERVAAGDGEAEAECVLVRVSDNVPLDAVPEGAGVRVSVAVRVGDRESDQERVGAPVSVQLVVADGDVECVATKEKEGVPRVGDSDADRDGDGVSADRERVFDSESDAEADKDADGVRDAVALLDAVGIALADDVRSVRDGDAVACDGVPLTVRVGLETALGVRVSEPVADRERVFDELPSTD